MPRPNHPHRPGVRRSRNTTPVFDRNNIPAANLILKAHEVMDESRQTIDGSNYDIDEALILACCAYYKEIKIEDLETAVTVCKNFMMNMFNDMQAILDGSTSAPAR